MTDNRTTTSPHHSGVSPLNPAHVQAVEKAGGKLLPLDPIGAEVHGIDFSAEQPPSPEALAALEKAMAHRGFLVFKNDRPLGYQHSNAELIPPGNVPGDL